MKVLYPGHRYALKRLDDPEEDFETLQFVQRRPHHDPRPGTTNQEVCRALIDRIKVLDAEVPWEWNAEIINYLRTVIFLHEVRAFLRHREKAGTPCTFRDAKYHVTWWVETHYPGIFIDEIPTDNDGHWDMETCND